MDANVLCRISQYFRSDRNVNILLTVPGASVTSFAVRCVDRNVDTTLTYRRRRNSRLRLAIPSRAIADGSGTKVTVFS